MKIVGKITFFITTIISIYLVFGEYIYIPTHSESIYDAGRHYNDISDIEDFFEYLISWFYISLIFYPLLILFLSFFFRYPFLAWQRILSFFLALGVLFTAYVFIATGAIASTFACSQYSEFHFYLTLTMLWGVIWFLVLCFSGSYYSELFHWMFKKRENVKK